MDELNFTLKLKERFEASGKGERLEILHRIGEVIQLANGELDFRMTESFSALAACKRDTQSALGDTQLENSLQKPLSEVDSATLAKVVTVWSG